MTFPAVSLGDQFGHPLNPRSVLEDAPDMHTKTDVQLNLLAAYMNGQPTSNLAQFRATQRNVAAVAVAASATVKFDTVLTNTGGGSWNAATGLYTIPAAGGLFLLMGYITTASAVSVRMYISGIPTAVFASGNINGCATATAGRSSGVKFVPVRFNGGEQIGCRVTAAINIEGVTAGTDKHRFEAIQVGW
jgi:hypothetical protein